MVTTPPSRNLVAVVFALFVGLGLSTGVTGVAWPELRSSFGRPVSDLGVLLAVGTAGYFVAGLSIGSLTRRIGVSNLLVSTMFLGTISLLGYAVVDSWHLLLGLAVCLGFAGGTVDSTVNALVALHYGPRTMNLVHAFFGLGATTGPILVAATLTRGLPWQASYVVLAAIDLLLLVVLLRVRSAWPSRVETVAAEAGRSGLGIVVVVLLGVFVLYVGVEVAAGQWAYSLLTESRNVGELAAGFWVAVYWGGLTAGRLLLGIVGDRISPRSVLHLSMVGSVAGSLLFWFDPGGLGVVGLTLLGFSLAGVFPILVAMTPGWVGEDKAASVIGYQIAAAAAGSALIPWLAGWVIERNGLETLGPFILAIAVAMTILHLLLDRMAGDHSRLAQSRSSRS